MSTAEGTVDGAAEPDDVDFLTRRLGDLVKMGGEAKVAEMLQRFSEQLEEILGRISARGWPRADVHRVVGLGAMLGFQRLEQTWRTVEAAADAAPADGNAARVAAQNAIHFCKAWREQVAPDGGRV